MKRSLLAMAAVAICLATAPASADLLSDGGFEDNPNSAWIKFGNAFPDDPAPGIDGAFEGNESLKMFGNFTGGQNFTGAYQDVAVDGVNLSVGDLIQLSGSIAHITGDSLSGPNLAFLEITFVDTSPGGLGEFGFGDNTTASLTSAGAVDQWDFYITNGVFIPAEADLVRAKAVFIQDQDAGGAAFVDNVVLQKIPEPTSLSILGACAIGMVARRRRK